jgi:hypothetical protein
MRWTSCAVIVILFTLVPSAYGTMASLAGDRGAYALGTALMLMLAALLPGLWPRAAESPPAGPPNFLVAATVALAGISLLGWVSVRVLPAVFAGPLDPNRGDMLVIIEHAIANFLAGLNPYAIHHVPWDAPLSYGPVLWLPFVLPHVLQIDLRILTLASQHIVPGCLVLAASGRMRRGEQSRALGLLALAIALAANPGILRFHAIGHTQIYWPLLLVFAVALARRRFLAAAVALGLLVAARTTMVALVPVFFLHLWIEGALSLRLAAAFVLAAGLPFAWFVAADPGSVYYAMFGVYLKVMKGFVWYSTTWTQNTYGITGRLLERGLERYVEAVQLLSLTAVYLLSWRSLTRAGRPEPWMAIALLVFSMTTLWPVGYLYFDVWVFLACCLLACDSMAAAPGWRVARNVTSAAAVSVAIVLVAAAWRPGASFTIDVGDPASAGYTGGGFGQDVAVEDDGRSVVWVEGETARIRVPRAAWRGATVRIAIRPHAPHAGLVQRVSAAINGRVLGVATLRDGWQEITFPSRARDWRYGFNVLDLSFTYALPAAGSDSRALSAAVDRVTVE